jgi:hypothetical protein
MQPNKFPREQGYCDIHEVPEHMGKQETLIHLKNLGKDVVKGDLIRYPEITRTVQEGDFSCNIIEEPTFIFDGEQIVPLDYVNPNSLGSLPQKFRVIEGGVPIYYWAKVPRDFVWFDHTLVYDVCLNNIKYGIICDDLYGIFTTFIYDNKEYRIVYDYIAKFYSANDELVIGFESDETNNAFDTKWNEDFSFIDEQEMNKCIMEFKELLSCNVLIPFSVFSEEYMPEENDGKTLFCVSLQ